MKTIRRLLLIMIITTITSCNYIGSVIGNTLDTPAEVNDAVMNGSNAIKNYEWFKQQEADIRKLHQQETNHTEALSRFKDGLPTDKSKWSYFDRDEYQKLSTNITAQKDMVNRALENYNANSSMVSKNIFKNNLPSNLSRSFYSQKQLVLQ
tara:strand:- start:914 stop:1366 length:453 start_codon:yes stop_codon:yes gene_type:complete